MRTDVAQYSNPTSKGSPRRQVRADGSPLAYNIINDYTKNIGFEYLDSRDTKIQEKISVKRKLQEYVKAAIQNNSANPIPDNLMMIHK